MSEEVSEARKTFLAAYRSWLVRYAIHLALVESERAGGEAVSLLTIRRLLEEDEVLEHGFEDAALLWLLDVSRLGPFARRVNNMVAVIGDPKTHYTETWKHPGAPPTPVTAVQALVAQVESSDVEHQAPKRTRRARSP